MRGASKGMTLLLLSPYVGCSSSVMFNP